MALMITADPSFDEVRSIPLKPGQPFDDIFHSASWQNFRKF
jgi:hypothetical protein